MQLNLTTDYAIRCMLYLATTGKETSSRDISAFIAVEREFTQKILRKLRDAGLVKATMGKSGGYALAKIPEEISLMDIMRVTEDSMYINRCLEPDHYCTRDATDNCPVHRFYLGFQEHISHVLEAITLRRLVDEDLDIFIRERSPGDMTTSHMGNMTHRHDPRQAPDASHLHESAHMHENMHRYEATHLHDTVHVIPEEARPLSNGSGLQTENDAENTDPAKKDSEEYEKT